MANMASPVAVSPRRECKGIALNNCGQHVRPYPRLAKIKPTGRIALAKIGFWATGIPTPPLFETTRCRAPVENSAITLVARSCQGWVQGHFARRGRVAWSRRLRRWWRSLSGRSSSSFGAFSLAQAVRAKLLRRRHSPTLLAHVSQRPRLLRLQASQAQPASFGNSMPQTRHTGFHETCHGPTGSSGVGVAPVV